ncbi:MAG: KH domain-containing protein [Bdellovibrionales bacterium]|nr:KH domain-containing protein [Bdellovibrionales bacterium]
MIEVIAKSLVDLPEQVTVSEIIGENTTVIELRVAKTDIGKIIGKEGKTAKAIRTILLGAATKLKRRTVLEIAE